MKIPNEKCRKFIKSLPSTDPTPFGQVFVDSSLEVQDLLQMMLRWDPESRIPVAEGIAHKYLETLHYPEDEPVREPLDTVDFEFERRKITVPALREEIFREALFYYPDLLEVFHQEDRDAVNRHDISQYRLLHPGESQYTSDE